MSTPREDFFASINVNRDILEPLHSGIAIFNSNALFSLRQSKGYSKS